MLCPALMLGNLLPIQHVRIECLLPTVKPSRASIPRADKTSRARRSRPATASRWSTAPASSTKISAPTGNVSAYSGDTFEFDGHAALHDHRQRQPQSAANTRAHPCANGSAATGNTNMISTARICAAASHIRNPVVAKKFFVVPRIMLRDARVPVHAHRVPGARDARPQSRFLHEFSELHVVNHFHRQPPVRSHLFVGAAPDQLKRAHADVSARSRIVRAPRPHAPSERPVQKTSSRSFRLP